jgi:hypothetical protein
MNNIENYFLSENSIIIKKPIQCALPAPDWLKEEYKKDKKCK